MANELYLRLGFFIGLFALFALLEAMAPRRIRNLPRKGRWITNLTITFLNAVTLRALAIGLPLLAIGAAIDAQRLGWGLFHQLALPEWARGIMAILLLDLAIWTQHLITHKVPLFWRFHRMHHADRDFDVTTAVRFHPVEIAASMLLKIGIIYLVGPPAWAVLAFEILLSGTALFNHANLRIPEGLDRALRLILVTPDMHRIHHSVLRHEHDSNFGFALSIWDRLFRTLRIAPEGGHEKMILGLQWQDGQPAQLGWSLLLPFRK
jgi:sterol desaturase/sphingolipid hydroxylase (fatty acid hydroxylase superfamily)